MITKFDLTEPHLLTGKPRLQEIARILGLGILRLHNRAQMQLQPGLQQSLSPNRDTSQNNTQKLKKDAELTGCVGQRERRCGHVN